MTVADWVHIFCASKWLQIKVIEKNLWNVMFFQIKETALLECNNQAMFAVESHLTSSPLI